MSRLVTGLFYSVACVGVGYLLLNALPNATEELMAEPAFKENQKHKAQLIERLERAVDEEERIKKLRQ